MFLSYSFIPYNGRNALGNYTRAPLLPVFSMDQTFSIVEFEKKVCRVAFRKAFGQRLPIPADLRPSVGLLIAEPTLNSSRWTTKNADSVRKKKQILPSLDNDLGQESNDEDRSGLICNGGSFIMVKESCGLFPTASIVSTSQQKSSRMGKDGREAVSSRQLVQSGLQLMCSDWVLELLTDQIKKKRSVRAVVQTTIRDAEHLLRTMQSTSPVAGIRITATGRLGRQKKAMAQQITKSTGRVSLATLRQKVDYSQGFVVTKRGMVGLKVWVAYVA